MYKILIADDEGIMVDSLKTLIEKNFGGSCELESAKSGRAAIEIAERFHPDIVFMDLQMPGINGLQAIREIKRQTPATIFVVITAYDKFVFAKEAINLGVLEYLTKPVNHRIITEVITKAMRIVDEHRDRRSDDLRIREKMEAVLPIIESGFIYSLISDDEYKEDTRNYRELLGITQEYAQILVIEWGDEIKNGRLTNPVGAGVRAHQYDRDFREIIREFFPCVTGAMMSNKLVVCVLCDEGQMEYNERIAMIEKSRSMIRKLRSKIDMHFRVGIGSVRPIALSAESYKDAIHALRMDEQTIVHIDDVSKGCDYEETYPIEIERTLFDRISKGDIAGAKDEASYFFNWMVENYADFELDIKLKVLEFVLFAEKVAYSTGAITYTFRSRTKYLSQLMEMSEYEQIKTWFLEKILEACRTISSENKVKDASLVGKAKTYIDSHFGKDISLEDVSRSVDISPYYFSKLFKDETGENFIEYLTNVRIQEAKHLLQNRKLSIKEVCVDSGYSDPNYFSRIFKKYVGVTPSEYREKLQ